MGSWVEPPDCDVDVIAVGCHVGGRYISLRTGDTVELLDDVTGLPIDPADVIDCADEEFFTTAYHVIGPFTNVSGNGQVAAYGYLPGKHLHSWWVRNVGTGLVTLNFNGINVFLQEGEEMGSTAQDDRRLTDNPIVTCQSAGNVADFVLVWRQT